MKQVWDKPEIKALQLLDTNETKCFCENGIDEEYITYHNGKPNRPGHGHRPDKPHKPCPPTPTPDPDPNPEPNPES